VIGFVLAKRYAKAAIDLAQEAGTVTEVGQDLERVAELFAGSPQLVHVFSDPTVAPNIKEKVLEDVLRKGSIQELTQRFIHVLNKKKPHPWNRRDNTVIQGPVGPAGKPYEGQGRFRFQT
jgi:F0F1-type ATP synthase delta subunit